tara:strand:+ start:7197 stop:7490 length:294 start_codon:yes stop_codon:yes gene_type:complete
MPTAKKTAKKAPKKASKKTVSKKKECSETQESCSTSGFLRQRIVIMLLAANFLFTGYLVHSVIKLQDAILTEQTPAPKTTTVDETVDEVVPPLPSGE